MVSTAMPAASWSALATFRRSFAIQGLMYLILNHLSIRETPVVLLLGSLVMVVMVVVVVVEASGFVWHVCRNYFEGVAVRVVYTNSMGVENV